MPEPNPPSHVSRDTTCYDGYYYARIHLIKPQQLDHKKDPNFPKFPPPFFFFPHLKFQLPFSTAPESRVITPQQAKNAKLSNVFPHQLFSFINLTPPPSPPEIMSQISERCHWPPVKNKFPLACSCMQVSTAQVQECRFFGIPLEVRMMLGYFLFSQDQTALVRPLCLHGRA